MYRDEKLEMYVKGIREGQNTFLEALKVVKGIGPKKKEELIRAAKELSEKRVTECRVSIRNG